MPKVRPKTQLSLSDLDLQVAKELEILIDLQVAKELKIKFEKVLIFQDFD